MTLKFDEWPWKTIAHIFSVTSSFVYHFMAIGLFKLRFTFQKHSIGVEIGDLLSCATLKFDGWPWKTTGHLFYVTKSFVHHFIAICEFILELQSGNAQFGSKSAILGPVWPWNLMDDLENNRVPTLTYSMLLQALCVISQPSVDSNSSYIPETPNLGQNWRF